MATSSDTIDVLVHPIRNHFFQSQNKLVIGQRSRELAATFDDPSRVLYRHAGITLSNDQNNSFVYRGLPSLFNRWSVGGAEIVNPNHLSNAGRQSDQSSPSAGGVLAIPFDVIHKLNFYGSPYSSEVVGALGGVVDLDFNGQSSNFVKLGLLGAEASYQSKSKHSTLVHARYSTVGLLSDLGVDFGDEKIKFYDAFLRQKISDSWSASFSMGRSNNDKAALSDSSMWEGIKDLQSINYSSEHYISSLQYHGKNTHHTFNASLAKSVRRSEVEFQFDDLMEADRISNYEREDKILSYAGHQMWLANKSVLSLNWNFSTYRGSILRQAKNYKGKDDYIKLTPSWDRAVSLKSFSFRFRAESGINYMFSNRSDFRWEPSVMLSMKQSKSSIEFNYSQKYRKDRITEHSGTYIGFINANESYSFAYKYTDEERLFSMMFRLFELRLNSPELRYYKELYSHDGLSYFTAFNIEDAVQEKIRSRGIECMIDKSWKSGWYVNANFSLFESEYVDLFMPTEEDFGHLINIGISKSIAFRNDRELSFNLAYHRRGGNLNYRYYSDPALPDNTMIDGYHRLDLRLQWKVKKGLWVLDIQNVSNVINPAYVYYDFYLKSEVLQEQLGMIPLLSYKRYL